MLVLVQLGFLHSLLPLLPLSSPHSRAHEASHALACQGGSAGGKTSVRFKQGFVAAWDEDGIITETETETDGPVQMTT